MSEEKKVAGTNSGILEATPYPPHGDINNKTTSHTTPLPTYEEFEVAVVYRRFAGSQKGRRLTRLMSEWGAAKKILDSCGMNLKQLYRSPEIVYDALVGEKRSLDYSKKVISMLNAWGQFQDPPLAVIPNPRGFHREKIRDAYEEKCAAAGTRKTSQPLTPGLLRRARDKMQPAHYNWLYVSYYLGLRPGEVDSAMKELRVEKIGGYETLIVYQSKLKQLKREDRYKYLPLFWGEQKHAVQLLKEGNLVRPAAATLHKYLGRGVHSYAGRKGFSQMILKKGVDLKVASLLLGHSKIETTIAHYANRAESQVERIRQLMGKK